MTWNIIAFNILLFAIVGLFCYGSYYAGYHTHPYSKCSKIYEAPEDISECVWLLENN